MHAANAVELMSHYSIFDYGGMIADRVRMAGFSRALRRAIAKDSVVLDIGTGTGIFAMLACQMGARKVYAVEPDDAILLAREIAQANGLAERIQFINKLSTDIDLPELADVMVSDLGGLLPWFENHIPSIVDARNRLLKPGGTLIPRCDVAWAALVEAPEFYAHYSAGWQRDRFDLDMSAAQRMATNTLRRMRATPEQILGAPQSWATLDYGTVVDPNIAGELSWTVPRHGVIHGICLWFDRTLAPGILLSNAPGVAADQAPTIYANLFYPFAAPVAVARDDRVEVKLSASLIGADYVWRWETAVLDGAHRQRAKARFNQSTFHSAPLARAKLSKRAAAYVPKLNDEAAIDRFVIDRMAGALTLGEIAEQLVSEYPNEFPHRQAALNRVGDLAQKYSR